MATTKSTAQVTSITRFKNTSGSNKGLFATTSSTMQSGLNTVGTTAELLDQVAQIALVSVKISLAETIADGVASLVSKGYTEEEALEILNP